MAICLSVIETYTTWQRRKGSKLEDRSVEIIQCEREREKDSNKIIRTAGTCGTISKGLNMSNYHPRMRRERESWAKKIKLTQETSQVLWNIKICRPQKLRKPRTDISKKLTLKYLMRKLLKTKEKEKILRISCREIVGKTIGITMNFSLGIRKARREGLCWKWSVQKSFGSYNHQDLVTGHGREGPSLTLRFRN